MPTTPPTVWAGVDIGKTHHWVEVVDADGSTLLSRRVGNDQVEIDALVADVAPLAETVQWALSNSQVSRTASELDEHVNEFATAPWTRPGRSRSTPRTH